MCPERPTSPITSPLSTCMVTQTPFHLPSCPGGYWVLPGWGLESAVWVEGTGGRDKPLEGRENVSFTCIFPVPGTLHTDSSQSHLQKNGQRWGWREQVHQLLDESCKTWGCRERTSTCSRPHSFLHAFPKQTFTEQLLHAKN